MSFTAQRSEEPIMLYKDAVLGERAQHANVAQFVSFSPGEKPLLRHSCIRGRRGPERLPLGDAIVLLLRHATAHSVNIRAFDPEQPKAHEFLYGLTAHDKVVAHVRRLAASGLFTIVNETIDVGDGGVSGVAYGGVLEFAPDDTPRCVDKPGTASLPRALGLQILNTVYGFHPQLDQPDHVRTEFSIHPLRCGVRNEHTILWEEERTEPIALEATVVWPNNFSRLIGDKVFGLLLADSIGLQVPETIVVSRRVAPFRFGCSTGTAEYWTRTCPHEPVPGRFTTRLGWTDPYRLLLDEDPEGTSLASVLSQESVGAEFSGAAATAGDSRDALVEGVRGTGEEFMLGTRAPDALPRKVVRDVEFLLSSASKELGAVRLEWAHDGKQAWLLQLQQGATHSRGGIVYPGVPYAEQRFAVDQGLEALRHLAAQLEGTGRGIVLEGNVGITSHFGDVLRRARIPSRVERPVTNSTLSTL